DDRATMNLAYPAAPRTDVSDDYFGTKVADPYRWLEDMKSPDTQKWVRAENDLLQAYLGKLPERAALHRRIRELTSDSLYTQVKKGGGRYFFARTTAGGVSSGVYLQEGSKVAPRVILGPGRRALPNGVRLNGFSPSPDGRLLAYATSESQANVLTIRIMDIAANRDLPDVALSSYTLNGG